MSQEPQTLLEAVRYFSDPDVALEFVANFGGLTGALCAPGAKVRSTPS